ncbi:hypothetical protein [Flavobacterium ajazii]|uniref:hypothetical protein n=1 Tax=Flavobacterium ajazii TaxID=2692318 RepID=UPI0013D49788|nr:hypothetical protein [Flavobacterium ajazii]
MSFNNHFNLRRFSNLLKQDLLINKTKYLLTILGLGFVAYVLIYWFLNSNKATLIRFQEQINVYYLTCFTFYMMGAGVFIGTAFPDLADKIKTGNYLLTPGSVFEKFLVQFLVRIGVFIPTALGLFWIVIRLAKASLKPEILFRNEFFDPSKVPYFEFSLLVSRGTKLWDTWQIIFTVFAFFSYGVYLFAGTTFFKRYALIKTVVISGILFFSCILFSVILSHIFYPQETRGFDLQLQTFNVTENLDSTKFSLLALSLLSWIFFLPLAYFKLKEKEV